MQQNVNSVSSRRLLLPTIMQTGGWMKTVTQQTEILFANDHGVVTTQYSSLLVLLSNMKKKRFLEKC